MRQAITFCLLLTGLVVTFEGPVQADGHRGRCSKCNKALPPLQPLQPMAPMMSAAAPSVGMCETCSACAFDCTVTRTRPVVQTEMRPQQVTTYCNVTETRVRNETVVNNVPVTTCKTVTVDEGGYQMVWVPKPVTKQVAQTVIQQQVATRAVPYQVTRKVAQTTTQLVPVQTVRHITETVPVTAAGIPYAAPMQAYLPPPIAAGPTPNYQTMPAISVPMPQSTPTPNPDDSIPVPTRPSQRQNRDFGSPTSRSVPDPSDEARGRFVPAPSAAAVWNSRQNGFR